MFIEFNSDDKISQKQRLARFRTTAFAHRARAVIGERGAPGAGSWRFSCSTCGGVLADDKEHLGLWMIPAGLSQKPFEPTFHLHYKSKIYAMKDGLPKFETLSAAFGGDDKTLDE